ENCVRGDKVQCFPPELDSSPTHQLHFLQATLADPLLGDYRAVAFPRLQEALEKHGLRDKWHLSPYYVLALAVRPLAVLAPAFLREQLVSLIPEQCAGGGWGVGHAPTVEETAWVCYALYQALDQDGLIQMGNAGALHAALERGVLFLIAHRDEPTPNLWIDKCLYTPQTIVDVTVDAVIYRYLTDQMPG
ncbi:MAG: hypothetical protein AAF125_09925, partial [Chloroflexota bacterium]